MTATITWTDAVGAGVLGNLVQIPVERFDGWTPNVAMVGEREHALGTGIPYSFEFRSDDLISFRIDNLKGSDLAMARRLKIHLLRSGEVGVNATNELADLFTSATIAPGTEPQISEPTRENREYSFSVTLRSGTGSFVPAEAGRRGGIDYSLFGLRHDWDADALIGLVPDATRPSAFIDVIAGYNAVQATSGLRPVFYQSSGPNGHATLEFSRSRGDVMKSPVIGNPALGSTIFLVAKALGATGGTGDHIVTTFASTGTNVWQSRNGFVSETTLLSSSGGGDTVGSPCNAWFVAALVINPVSNNITPWFNGVAGTPFGIYSLWNALKEVWFGSGPVVGGTGTGNWQITRILYFDNAATDSVVDATSKLLKVEYGI